MEIPDEPEYGYLRQSDDGEWLLIPEDEVDEHDELEWEIICSEWLSGKWYALTRKYDDLYMRYLIKDEIQTLRVVLE